MRYLNSDTGVAIELVKLTNEEEKFYRQAVEKFRENIDWLTFEEFVFGVMSPLYVGRESHLDVVKDPLYLALEDMWLQLGVQQGMVKAGGSQKERTDGQRR